MKIMLLDDESYALKQYDTSLRSAGHMLLRFNNVEDARAAIPTSSPDLLILDIMMPPLSYGSAPTGGGLHTGVHFLREFRKTHPLTPVLIFTNVDMTEALDHFAGEPLLRIVTKLEVVPSDLPAVAESFVRTSAPRPAAVRE